MHAHIITCIFFSVQDSSLPAAVFVWNILNHGEEDAEVSITFTFKNGQGEPEDSAGGVWSETFSPKPTARQQRVTGVMIHQEFNSIPCTYAIAAKNKVRINPL